MNSLLFTFLMMFSTTSFSKLVVITTTTDIQYLVKQIAADKVEVSHIVKGTQDPHFIESKPSYMVKLQKADLLISNGLSLEAGWLPNLILGSRNPKINPQQPGNLELSQFVTPIDSMDTNATRAQGHVHPDGNPHFMLDPQIAAELGLKVADKLVELDPENKLFYQSQAQKFKKRILSAHTNWKLRTQKTKIKNLVTYHASLNYFLKSVDLKAPLYLEAKPGVPPSAQHLLKVIEFIKTQGIKIILVDNFFDTKVAEKVAVQAPQVKVKSVGISVESNPNLKSLEDVYEQLVSAIEGS